MVLKTRFVLVPRDAIDARRRSSFELKERPAEQIDSDVVEQRREPNLLVPSCRRSSAGDTLSQLCVWRVLPRTALPWPRPFPPSPPQPLARPCSATSAELWASPTSPGRASSDYGCVLLDADRSGRTFPDGQPVDIPVPVQMASTRARGLRTTQGRTALAIARRLVLPSAFLRRRPGPTFRGSILCPRVPLSTLRRHPRGCRRMNSGPSWLARVLDRPLCGAVGSSFYAASFSC